MPVLYTNNAATTLASGITAAATSLTVATGKGALFPAPSSPSYFYATLSNADGSLLEIVKVTARATDTFTITRAQDGTSALAWNAGDKIELRITKSMLDDFKLDTQAGITSSNVTTALGYTPLNPTTSQTAAYVYAAPTALAGAPTFRALASGDLPTYSGSLTSSQVTTALGYTPYNSTNPNGYTTNTGTVTSVALSLPSFITVTGSPVTTSGTLTGALASQTANTVFAAPNGAAGAPTFRALVSADLPTYTGTLTSSQVTTALGYTPYNSTNPNGYTSNTGTVTSVALSLPAIFSVTGSPVTTTGTLTASLASQTANTVFAAPNGAAGAPTFRALVAADIPTLNQNTTGTASNVTGTVAIANGGTGATTASAALTNLGAYPSANPNGYTSNTGTVTSVGGTGTVSGLTLSGTVTTSGSLTLGGTLSVTPSNFASQTANTVLAAPNGAAGTPTFRALVAADIPTLNQNTTGTASNVTGTVAIANGGTGSTTASGALTNLGAAATNQTMYIGTTGVVINRVSASLSLTGVSIDGNAGTVTNGVYTTGNQSIAGVKTFTDTTASTSATTGAVIVSGGVGVGGAVYAAGNVTAYSDERLKTNWRPIDAAFVAALAQVKCGVYDRTDISETQVGVSAQSLQAVLPEAVVGSDVLSVVYGNAALVAAIKLAEEVVALKARLAELEARLNAVEAK